MIDLHWHLHKMPRNQKRKLAIQRASDALANAMSLWLEFSRPERIDPQFDPRLVEFARGPMRELLPLEKRCSVRVL